MHARFFSVVYPILLFAPQIDAITRGLLGAASGKSKAAEGLPLVAPGMSVARALAKKKTTPAKPKKEEPQGCPESERTPCQPSRKEEKYLLCKYDAKKERYDTTCADDKKADKYFKESANSYCGECTLDTIDRLFLSSDGLQAFNDNKEEAKDWYKNNLWETTLAFAGGLDPDQVDYDAFFDGFMAAFYGNLSDIIDGDLLEIRIDEALGNQQSRALSMSSFKNDSFLEASTMNLRGLKRIGPPAPVKLSEAQCWTLLGDTLFDMIVLMITGIFGINDKSTRTVIKSTVNMSKFGPAFALTMTKVKAFDGKFIGDFFLAFASSVTVKDFASALYQNKWDIGVSLALAIIARLAAVWLTAGAALAFQLASIGWSVWLLWKNIDELRDGGCWDIFLGKTGCKVRRELLECNTSNPCLLPEEVCDKETASWTCAYEEKLCPPFTSCDKRDGLCKEDDELIPCVAVIDEDSSFGYPTQAELWQQFRDVYPSRPFCLLIPNPEDQVGIPQGFRDDPYTIIEPNIVRDDGNQAQASNWTELCGLQDYDGTSNSVGFVGIFVDNSGSMFKSEVLASYNNFIQDMADRHIVVKEVVNSAENWILPFLVTLVPPPDCVTRHNEKGTCITVSDCDVKEGTNVPWVATDPEPNCRLLPTNVQCCVPKTIII